jgi:hypothetical protein
MPNPKETLIFLHIPKAAGTTLHAVIDAEYDRQSVYTLDGWPETEARFRNLPEPERARLRVLKGHMEFGLHTLLPGPSTYVTILRQPLDRLVSHYYYVRGNPAHHLHAKVRAEDLSLVDYVLRGSTIELDNGQTRLLSASEGLPFGRCTRKQLELAKRNLRDYFSVVGLTERFDETLLLLRARFGWRRSACSPQNVTKDRPPLDAIPRSDREQIARLNCYDQELYDYAAGLFERQIAEAGIAFRWNKAKAGALKRLCALVSLPHRISRAG